MNISISISFSSTEMAMFEYITLSIHTDSVSLLVWLPHNTLEYYAGEILWTHKTVTKTTVDDDEMGTTSFTIA